MKIPQRLTLDAIKEFANDVYDRIKILTVGDMDLKGRRITGAGEAVAPFDYMRKAEFDAKIGVIQDKQSDFVVKERHTALDVDIPGDFLITGNYKFKSGTSFTGTFDHALTVDTTWTFQNAGSGTIYQTGGVDVAVADGGLGVSTVPAAGHLPTGNGSGGYTVQGLNGTAAQIIVTIGGGGSITLSTPQNIGVTSSPAFNNVQVLPDAYGVGWNGSDNVPTKNDVYDKIEAIMTTLGTIQSDITSLQTNKLDGTAFSGTGLITVDVVNGAVTAGT